MSTGSYLCPYQILSKYFKSNTQEHGLEIHSGEITRKQRGCPSCARQAYWSLYMPLQNIIKIFQTIKKSLRAHKFGLEIYSVE